MANDVQPSLTLPDRSTSEWFLVRWADGRETWHSRAELAAAPRDGRIVGEARRV